MNQLFRIAHSAWATLSPDEVNATVEGLTALNLFHLPYPEVDLEFVSCVDVIRFVDPVTHELSNDGIKFKNGAPLDPWSRQIRVLYKGLTLDSVESAWMVTPEGDKLEVTEHIIQDLIPIISAGFICLLATRNVAKETKEDKLAKLGIGKRNKHRYRYITTISLPKEMEDDPEHHPTGEHKRPHWRRGHIRNQRFGPNLQFTKQVWIEPIFVNADPTFVDQREAYNLSKR